MNDFQPDPYDEMREGTRLRFQVDKIMHGLTNEQLREVIAFIAGLPEPKPVPPDYRPKGAYTQNAYWPYIGDKRWFKVE